MQPEIEEVRALNDPADRARRYNDLVNKAQELSSEAARGRREAIEELKKQGKPQREIASMLGVSPSRVSRLLSTAPNIERALLGAGPVTIAVGGKQETGRSNPSIVVSKEANRAYAALRTMCVDYGLGVAQDDVEIVPPPGIVQLNRDDLIVLTSPRLLPIVGQTLDADDHLGFTLTDEGWHVIDRDKATMYRSPSDRGEPADYGYLGRLPRPDGRGTFLYIAGIHAMGTLGAVQFLADNIEKIYQEAKTKRWSVLIRCTYDPADRSITTTEAITPIHVVGK